mmetsp:Transcript_42972/g.80176  ORF Transcript_42972/g.80176 Transcript_42972/m.80176 type:complete len:200 (-) Transcript_42972:86-685(-)
MEHLREHTIHQHLEALASGTAQRQHVVEQPDPLPCSHVLSQPTVEGPLDRQGARRLRLGRRHFGPEGSAPIHNLHLVGPPRLQREVRHSVGLPVLEVVANHGDLRRRTAHLPYQGVRGLLPLLSARGDNVLAEGRRVAVGSTVAEAAHADVRSLVRKGLGLLEDQCWPTFDVHVRVLQAEMLIGRSFSMHAGKHALAEG